MEINEFQRLIRDTYYHKDVQRGLSKTFMWFVEEVGELSEVLRKFDAEGESKSKYKIAEEIADIIAWACSIANLLNIDLEEAIKNKYPNQCLKCNSRPCRCDS
ncbi:MAG: nucleotide pyrophosphohydrolase [Candidatus Lokiarchaeota archaeon]|nr:nucleotide pyrophosphohydrolase [Candidatus Lokiarchaeota archaeon]